MKEELSAPAPVKPRFAAVAALEPQGSFRFAKLGFSV